MKRYRRLGLNVLSMILAVMVITGTLMGAVGSVDAAEYQDTLEIQKTAQRVNTSDIYSRDFWIEFDVAGNDVTVPPQPLDVVLILDRSSSMGSNMTKLKNSAKKFAEKIIDNSSQNRVAVVSFGKGATTVQGLTNNIRSINSGISGIGASDSYTQPSAGFSNAKTVLDGIPSTRNSKQVVVLFTDGAPSVSGENFTYTYCVDATRQAAALKNAHPQTSLYCVYWDFGDSISGSYELEDNQWRQDSSSQTGYVDSYYGWPVKRESHWSIFGTTYSYSLQNVKNFLLQKVLPSFADDGNLYEAAKSEAGLDEVFDGIAGSILKFAKDATITDVLDQKFEFNIQNASDIQWCVRGSNNWQNVSTWSSATNPYYSKIDATGEIKITFPGEMHSDGVSVKFKIKAKDGVYSSAGASETHPDLPTNQSAVIDYTNVNGHSSQKSVESPKVYLPQQTGSLTVRKQLVSGSANTGQQFKFIVTINGQPQEIYLTANAEQTISNLPVGTQFTVEEDLTNTPDYQLSSVQLNGVTQSGDTVSGTISGNEQVVFTNRSVAKISITKTVVGEIKDPQQSFVFKVTGPGVEYYQVIRASELDGNQSKTVTITGLPNGTYTVEELSDWSWQYEADKESDSGIIDDAHTSLNFQFTNTRNDKNWIASQDTTVNTFRAAQ